MGNRCVSKNSVKYHMVSQQGQNNLCFYCQAETEPNDINIKDIKSKTKASNSVKICDKCKILFEGKLKSTLNGHSESVSCLLSLKDKSIVSGSNDNKIKIWKKVGTAKNYICTQTLEGHTENVNNLIKLPDGFASTANSTDSTDGSFRIWKKKKQSNKYECVQIIQTGDVQKYLVMPNGSIVLANNYFNLLIIEKETPSQKYKISHRLKNSNDEISSILLLSDGSLVSGSYDRFVNIWRKEIANYECVQRLEHAGRVLSLLRLSDDSIVSASAGENKITIWKKSLSEYNSSQELEGHEGDVWSLLLLSDDWFASASEKTIIIWKKKSGRFECSQKFMSTPTYKDSLFLLPNGSIANLGGAEEKSISIYKKTDRNEYCFDRNLEGHTKWVKCLIILPGVGIATGSFDDTIRIWE